MNSQWKKWRAGLAALGLASLTLVAGCPEASNAPDARPVRAGYYSAPEPNLPESERVPLDQAPYGQLVYVPVYSHVYHAGGRPYQLEATVSIRNTDPENSITINSVDYYNGAGEFVRKELAAPLRLRPLESKEFLIETRDTSGGAGANYMVEWVAAEKVHEPIIECLMAGMSGTHGLSFARPSRVLIDKS